MGRAFVWLAGAGIVLAMVGDLASGQDEHGTILGWGRQVVADLNQGYTGIAAGGDHSLGLKSDGSIVPWEVQMPVTARSLHRTLISYRSRPVGCTIWG